MYLRENEFSGDALQVRVAELLVATADEADCLIDQSIQQVLRLLRERMHMDVVFVSQFTGGERVFRHVEQAPGSALIAVGQADPLEASWCQRVVDGRLPELILDTAPLLASGKLPGVHPFPIGTHLSTPILLDNGQVYGTLCCFSFGVSETITQQDLKRLRFTAQLMAQKIERTQQEVAQLTLEPMDTAEFKASR